MSGVAVPLRISVQAFAGLTCASTILALATTYYLYVVVEKKGPAFLPMLSDTFVPVPGNYISRVVLSLTALGLFALGAVDYFSPVQLGGRTSKALLLGLSSLASFCLGIVGAVCESDDVASCEGDLKVHDITAVILFVGYDLYMAVISIQYAVRHGHTAAAKLLLGCVALSIVAKLRWLPPAALAGLLVPIGAASEHPNAEVLLACFEYLDAASIFLWVVAYCRAAGRGFAFGFVTTAPSDGATPDLAPISVHASVTVATLARLTVGLGVATIAATFAIALGEHTISPVHQWPYISDLWVSKPSNMISRYTVCLTGALVVLTQLGHYAAVQPSRKRHATTSLVAHAASLVSGFALMGVGMCNEKETAAVHYACAAAFFGTVVVWMLLDLASSVNHWAGPSRAAGVIAASLTIAAKIAQAGLSAKPYLSHPPYAPVGDHRGLAGVLDGLVGGAAIGMLGVTTDPPMRPHVAAPVEAAHSDLPTLEWIAAAGAVSYFLLSNLAAPTARLAYLSRSAATGDVVDAAATGHSADMRKPKSGL